MSVAAGEPPQTQTRPVALFGMRLGLEDPFDHRGDIRADACAPVHQLGGRPLKMRPVAGGHVVRIGAVALSTVLPYVAGNPVVARKHLDVQVVARMSRVNKVGYFSTK